MTDDRAKPVRLTLLHSAPQHCATFDALRDEIAPTAQLRHVVRPDWLVRAQAGGDDALSAEIAVEIGGDRALCTCTTLGPLAASCGALRIDAPMMQAAARIAGSILMAYCLDSTRAPSLALLEDALAQARRPGTVQVLGLQALWPLFEAGQHAAFAQGIAKAVRRALTESGDVGCVVLAQASMAGAAPLLHDLGVPVLASPEIAMRALLG